VDNQELQITPEMIEAGASIIRGYDSRFEDEETVAAEVFDAMLRVAAAPSADGRLPPQDARCRQ
jgi:hypothetical protein